MDATRELIAEAMAEARRLERLAEIDADEHAARQTRVQAAKWRDLAITAEKEAPKMVMRG